MFRPKRKPFVEPDGGDIAAAYEDIRDDDTENNWAIFEYEGKKIQHRRSGIEYSEFLEELSDDDRLYGYIAVGTGDEMSKRKKFLFVTWVGCNVSPLKRAAVSTDKAFVKEICNSFGKEIFAEEKDDLDEGRIRGILELASGAAYGSAH